MVHKAAHGMAHTIHHGMLVNRRSRWSVLFTIIFKLQAISHAGLINDKKIPPCKSSWTAGREFLFKKTCHHNLAGIMTASHDDRDGRQRSPTTMGKKLNFLSCFNSCISLDAAMRPWLLTKRKVYCVMQQQSCVDCGTWKSEWAFLGVFL